MNRSWLIPLFLLCVFVAERSHSQVVIPEKEGDELHESLFGLGLAGGPASGIGLSFRHHLPLAFSYQLTGGVIKVDEKLYYSVGGEFQYDLVRSERTRIFAVGGLGYYYAGEGRNEMEGPGRLGLGVGGEFQVYEGLHGIAEGVFTYFTDGTILPLPQAGLFYYFR